MKQKVFAMTRQIAAEVLGSIFIAAGIYNFAVHAKFPISGFSGISVILYQLFHVPIGFSTILLNIPVAILCYRLLGRKFFISSMRCMLISSVIIDYVAPLFPVYEGDRLLAALCTGVLSGLGYAIIYMNNSSTGGMDFIIMGVKAVRPYFSLGKISFATDCFIVFAGAILFGDVDGIIYGMIVNFLLATVINSGKMALIVTEHGKEICDVIDATCERGSTILKGQGGYRCEEKEVVMCACSNKEMYLVQQAVKAADPDSFTVILESNEVHGEGFRMLEIGEYREKAVAEAAGEQPQQEKKN